MTEIDEPANRMCKIAKDTGKTETCRQASCRNRRSSESDGGPKAAEGDGIVEDELDWMHENWCKQKVYNAIRRTSRDTGS